VLFDELEFSAHVDRSMAARVDGPRLAAETALYQLVGRLGAGDDLGSLHASLRGVAEHAWYDPVAGALLVAFRPGDLGPLARSEIVHEVVHALTDQHYRWSEIRTDLVDVGADDRLAALDALVEGDATYVQLLYIQSVPADEQDEIAAAFLEPSAASADAPDWVIEDLAFVFDAGFDFVADLVSTGGSAAVDRAYLDPPGSSEHIVHPERYRRAEAAKPLEPLLLTVEQYTGLREATFGEWGLRLMLEETAPPGLLTQRVDGWGGDRYQIFVNDNGGIAFAFAYLGDTEAHAIEVTEGFLDLAEDVLGLGDGTRVGGGVVYRRNNRPWMFIDREEDGLVVVIASERGVGEDLADLLTPP
jgi:hypothetical protein